MTLSTVPDGSIIVVKTWHGWIATKFEKRRYRKGLDKYFFNGKWYKSENVRYATSEEVESYIKRLERDLAMARETIRELKEHEINLERFN